MTSASKTSFRLKNLKILRTKVMNNLINLSKKFCEFRPWNAGLQLPAHALFLPSDLPSISSTLTYEFFVRTAFFLRTCI